MLFVWPCEEEGERRPQPRRRWRADKSFEPASAPFKFDFKEYELKLLAAFARCYRGEITLKQLPMIPAQMAELILRSGRPHGGAEGSRAPPGERSGAYRHGL
jgi:hypothetical protein